MAAVAYSNTLADQRAKDVQQILKSIKELASIFNDLSLLVVEQVRKFKENSLIL
jgi:t-SNARE complex subunit (syntaxin)